MERGEHFAICLEGGCCGQVKAAGVAKEIQVV